MQSARRLESARKEKPKEEKTDTEPKKSISTPRNFVQKPSSSDIYGLKKLAVKTPRKSISAVKNEDSPMRNYLKSTSSSQLIAKKSIKNDTPMTSRSVSKKNKDVISNVTVNSPIGARRNLNADLKRLPSKEVIDIAKTRKPAKELKHNDSKENSKRISKDSAKIKVKDSKEGPQDVKNNKEARDRTKTRTLKGDEAKVFKEELIDNNEAMMKLSKKLAVAKPKSFFVGLDENSPNVKNTSEQVIKQEIKSDEEISYEDDFESYESDFESYHSDATKCSDDTCADGSCDHEDGTGDESKAPDEERLLDSGSFDLREQNGPKVPMDFIVEDSEDTNEKKASLTDEGFQEMSSSSAVPSLKTVHVDVLDRPLFIDFTKSKQRKKKRRIFENLQQRAKDLLGMITLHEMSYVLFEMKPIPYELYMATFGRANYTQISTQTFEDGVSTEIQTDDVILNTKWTQCPVRFSKEDIVIERENKLRKYSCSGEDFAAKFFSLVNESPKEETENNINSDFDYKTNPLRTYFEQKYGVGDCQILPRKEYESKLQNREYDAKKLVRFLKKKESKIYRILSKNAGNNTFDLQTNNKPPFSKGFLTISLKKVSAEKYSFLKSLKTNGLVISESNSNLILTLHSKVKSGFQKSLICLWDVNLASCDPMRVLVAIEDVAIGRFRGNRDGIFVGALEDGSIHLWDLSEVPMWRAECKNEREKIANEQNSLTSTERGGQCNDSQEDDDTNKFLSDFALQSSAYTNSAVNVLSADTTEAVQGLEFVGDLAVVGQGRKVLGQICSLQRNGILTTWTIIQEKTKIPTDDKSTDKGKAYWSKTKLEKSKIIHLNEYIEVALQNAGENFNLNAAKRRLAQRKQERVFVTQISRQKSASSSDFDIDRPTSAAREKKLLDANINTDDWGNGLICNDLKIMKWNNVDNYLVARNCGEVLRCVRNGGDVKVFRFIVTSDTSAVTCIEASPHKLPYFLAATDSGTVNLCSLAESRVLLTLDTRNAPSATVDNYHTDIKGRYVGTHNQNAPKQDTLGDMMLATSVLWCRLNPCCLFSIQRYTVTHWALMKSDIYADCECADAAQAAVMGDSVLALLTPNGDVQIHKLFGEEKAAVNIELFNKYMSRL